jgi:general secretion pathway protein C
MGRFAVPNQVAPAMAAVEAGSQPFSTERLLERLSNSRWLPLGASILAFVLLLYGLAQTTWRFLDPSATTSSAVTRPPDSVQPPLDLHPLLTANIFGQAQNTATGAIDPNQLPLSSLNLVLTGVMARGPGSFAFLSVNGQPEAPVSVGQEITAGALLEAVYPDRVVLRRGVKLESVLLKDSDAILAPGSIVPAGADASSAVRATGSGTYTVDRQALTQGLTAETLSQATVEPGAGGLVVRNVQAGSVFEKLGLRAGDVLRTISGQPVANLEDVMKIYAQFATAPPSGPIAVEVARGGQTEILQYQMK